MAGTNTNKDAGRTGAHEMQRCLVRRAATDNDGDVDFTHELLEVQGFNRLGDMFGRDNSSLNDEKIEFRFENGLGQRLGALRSYRRTRGHTCSVDFANALSNEFGLDWLHVDLLHTSSGLLNVELADLFEQ